MNWLEVSVEAEGRAAEAVSEVFNRYGRGGAVVEEIHSGDDDYHYLSEPLVTVKTYLPAGEDQAPLRRKLEEAIRHLRQLYPLPAPRFRELAEDDWAHAWKKHYHPLRVGQRLVIVPSWESYSATPGEVTITLDPGLAFGTGLHPTTRLCLAIIEERMAPGARVLDLGTGSGILAIAAARLGAGSVLALDVDAVAVEAARQNVAANGVAGIVTVGEGSLEAATGLFDFVVVNILAWVIVALAGEGLVERVRPGGLLVVAGLIAEQEAGVAAALAGRGAKVVNRRREKDWVALVAAVERVRHPPSGSR